VLCVIAVHVAVHLLWCLSDGVLVVDVGHTSEFYIKFES
jgi:hypothetical protein